MMIGMRAPSRQRRHSSRPFLPGKPMSSSTRSGAKAAARLSAVLPLPVVRHSYPSTLKVSPSTRASEESSSTIKMRVIGVLRDGKRESDRGADGDLTLDRQPAPVIQNDPLCDGEPQTAAARDGVAAAKESFCDVFDL